MAAVLMPKQLILVLGMHRSGTSLVTKSIETLGFKLGDKLMPPREDNPKGFFEDVDIVAVNEKLLASARSSWDNPQHLLNSKLKFSKALEKEASELLDRKFRDVDRLVVKDPRMSVLLAVWQPLIAGAGLEVHHLLVNRNPLDVAASLKARDSIVTEKGVLLWHYYNLAILETLGKNCLPVDYDRFLTDTSSELERVARYLSMHVDEGALDQFMDEFVDSSLRHHQHNLEDMLKSRQPASTKKLASLLAQLSEDKVDEFESALADCQSDQSNLDTRFLKLQVVEDFSRQQQLNESLEAEHKKYQLLTFDLAEVRKENKRKADHLAKNDQQAKELEAEVISLADVLKTRDDELEEKNRHILKNSEQIQYLTQEIAGLADILKTRDGELEEKGEHIRLNQAQISEQESEIGSLAAELDRRDQELAEKNLHISKNDEQINSLTSEIKDLAEVLNKRDAELEEKNRHIHLNEEQIRAQQADMENLSSVLSERDAELSGLRGQFAEVSAELQETQRESLQQISSLTEQNHLLEEMRASLTRQNEDLDRRLVQLEQNIAMLTETNTQYQQHLADFDRIHRDLLGSISFKLGRAITYPVRKPFTKFILPAVRRNPKAAKVTALLRGLVASPLTTLKLLSLRRIKNFYLLLTSRQDLLETVTSNYQELLTPEFDDLDYGQVHTHSEEELASITITFPETQQPRVSVIIPVYNQIDHTLHCLKSIQIHFPRTSFEIIVADDCSTDSTESVLSRQDGITLVRHKENLGFLRSCNRAVEFARGEFVFLLNNDTAVKPGWLDSLVQVFDLKQDAGIVGSKLIFPTGELQEAGGIIWNDASGWNYGRNQDPDAPEYCYLKETDYISGAAMMFPRELFNELGRFDEAYVPAYYEDTDLAFAVRDAGRKVYFQPASVIVHYEGISHGTDTGSGIKQHQVVNQQTFLNKWKTVLESEHYPNAEQVLTARERSADKTNVLVIDHYVPHYDKDAGSRSTYLYLKLLVESGCNVKFLGDNFYRHEPYTTDLEALGIEVLCGNYYHDHWRDWFLENPGYIDVVYMMRPHIAVNYIDFVNQLNPRPKTIYFGHDLHYLRLEREYQLSGEERIKTDAEYWKEREFDLFHRFDMVYYPSQVEIDEIHKAIPDLSAKAIPLYAFDSFSSVDVDFRKRSGVIFVGGFNHPPNADGLTWFCNEVLPKVVAQIPDLQLHIVGSNMPDEIKALASGNLVVEGFLSDEELEALYERVRMSIVPLRFGAGIKGKVLEAMDHGVPVVTTHIGAEGIPSKDVALTIESDAGEMALAIVSLYRSEVDLKAQSQAARSVVKQHFSTDAVRRVIAEDFLLS